MSSYEHPADDSMERQEKEKEAATRIAAVDNLTDLYAILRELGKIQGGMELYDAETVIQKIENARMSADSDMAQKVTSGGDLKIRDKVRELLKLQ